MTIWTIDKTINTPIKPERDTHDMIGAFRPEVIDFLIGAVLDNREMLSIWTSVRVAWVRGSRSGWWSILLRVQRQDAQANWWCWWVSYKKGLFLIASSIRMDIILITFWMCQSLSTTGSITQNCLLTNKITSMELRTFGTRPRDTCTDLTVFQPSIFLYFWRNVSGDLTTPSLNHN